MTLAYRSLEWRGSVLRLLDQRWLPDRIEYIDLADERAVADAIREMVVRGAPAIGVSAAYALVLAALRAADGGRFEADGDALLAHLDAAAAHLLQARPTAVNLRWSLQRMMRRARMTHPRTPGAVAADLLDEANRMRDEDVAVNRAIGQQGVALVPDGARIIHHCNTGALGTVDYGTALGIIRTAHERGKSVHVFVDETRPRLQGARLTAWELRQLGVAHTVIVDSAAAHIMRTVGVDLCVVGCDRVAANGDVANKIGTYALAIAARAHGVPFYVAAPTSTIDLETPTGDAVDIEERPASELTQVGDARLMPDDVPIRNPAFDITPAEYITAIVTERGVVWPPFQESLARLMGDN